jgi:hypothetical protein
VIVNERKCRAPKFLSPTNYNKILLVCLIEVMNDTEALYDGRIAGQEAMVTMPKNRLKGHLEPRQEVRYAALSTSTSATIQYAAVSATSRSRERMRLLVDGSRLGARCQCFHGPFHENTIPLATRKVYSRRRDLRLRSIPNSGGAASAPENCRTPGHGFPLSAS